MLARFFGQTNSATPILLVFYVLALSGVHFYLHVPAEVEIETRAGSISLANWMVWLCVIPAMLIVYFGNQWLYYGKFHLLRQHAFMPVVFLPLWLLGIQLAGPVFSLHTLILFVVYQLWLRAYQGQHMFSISLNTGFVLGLGSLLDSGYLWLLGFTVVVYFNFGRLNLRTLIIPLVGYFTIWVDALALEFLINDSTNFLSGFGSHFNQTNTLLNPDNSRFVWFLAVLLVPGITEFTVTFSRANVFKRQVFTLFLLLAGVAVAMYFLHGFSPLQLAVLLTPITMLFVNYLQYLRKKWIQEILLLIILSVFTAFEFGWV